MIAHPITRHNNIIVHVTQANAQARSAEAAMAPDHAPDHQEAN